MPPVLQDDRCTSQSVHQVPTDRKAFLKLTRRRVHGCVTAAVDRPGVTLRGHLYFFILQEEKPGRDISDLGSPQDAVSETLIEREIFRYLGRQRHAGRLGAGA